MTDALEALAAKLGMRVSQRWNGTPEQQAAYASKHGERRVMAEETDIQIASRVRMLMRDDMDHEAVVCCARDRLCALTVEKGALTDAAKPLADLISEYPPSMGEDDDEIVEVTLGDLRALKRALAQAA